MLPSSGSVYTDPSVIHTDGSEIVLYGSAICSVFTEPLQYHTEHVLYTEPDGSTAILVKKLKSQNCSRKVFVSFTIVPKVSKFWI